MSQHSERVRLRNERVLSLLRLGKSQREVGDIVGLSQAMVSVIWNEYIYGKAEYQRFRKTWSDYALAKRETKRAKEIRRLKWLDDAPSTFDELGVFVRKHGLL